MKTLHLLPLLFLALAPLSPAQEAPATTTSAAEVCDGFRDTMRELLGVVKKGWKSYLPDPAEINGDSANSNGGSKWSKEIVKEAKAEAKQNSANAKKKVSKYRSLVTMLKAVEKDSSTINQLNRKGVTPLMLAAELGEKEAVQWLLDMGADPTVEDANGTNAASLASENQHAEIAALLSQPRPQPKAEEPKPEEAAKPADAPKPEEAAKPAEEPTAETAEGKK